MNALFGSVVYHYRTRSDEFARIWGNTPESFTEHVDHFTSSGRCVGADDFLHGRLAEGRNVLLSFDDGLKEHHAFFSRLLHARGIKALFDVPTCIFDGEPADPQVTHFGAAYYGVRTWYSFIAERLNATLPAYTHLLPREPRSLGVLDLLAKIKVLFKMELPRAEARELLLWLYRTHLLPRFPDFMERVYLTKDEVREIRLHGHTIGCHTRTHGVLRNIESDPALLAQEIGDAKRTLEDVLQENVDVFTYPFGSADEILQNSEIFRSLGFNAVFTTCRTPESLNPLCIGRYSTYRTDTPEDLEKNMQWYSVQRAEGRH